MIFKYRPTLVRDFVLSVPAEFLARVSCGEYLISYSLDVTHSESADTDCYW